MEKSNIATFIETGYAASRTLFPINRTDLPDKATFQYCEKVFDELTDHRYSDYSLEDLSSVVMDLLPDYYNMFTGVAGAVEIDFMHLAVVHRVLQNKGDEREKVIRGMLYKFGSDFYKYLITNQLKTVIKKKDGVSLLVNRMTNDVSAYGWKGCSVYFHKCFLSWANMTGYRQYYYEKPMQNLIASTVYFSKGKMGYKEAERKVLNTTDAFFVEGLDKPFENLVAPFILGGNISGLNGIFADDYKTANIELRKQEGYINNNVYTRCVRPHLMRINGLFCESFLVDRCKSLEKALGNNPETNKGAGWEDSYVYMNYVTPTRIGVKIANYLDIETCLNTLHPMLMRQERFSIDKCMMGEYVQWEHNDLKYGQKKSEDDE